ncbi:MAG: DUF6178 family protein, partial [Desulfobulbus sp.]
MRNASASNLLARIFEEASLVERIRELDTHTLTKLIRRIGLEDAGEIVALAATEQLTEVFDEDLWAADEPGEQEQFNLERFLLWLEILLESGEKYVADKLTEIPEDFVTLAIQRSVLVINIDELAMEMFNSHHNMSLIEKALENRLYEEIGEYRIISRRQEGWDAIVAVLLALDHEHHEYLDRLLSRCSYASSEYIENNGGLYEVLSADEMLESDALADRETRRARNGYVSTTDAASFLALPQVTTLQKVMSSQKDRDPITCAYFRSFNKTPIDPKRASPRNKARTDQERFLRLLREASVIATEEPPLLEGTTEDPSSRFQVLVGLLRNQDMAQYTQRMEELAYLANVLMAGSSFAGRRFRQVEAAEAVIAICNLGLEHCLTVSSDLPLEIVKQESADRLFRIGWHLTFWNVSMVIAEQLENILDEYAARGKEAALRAIRKAIRDRQPWQILPKLDTLVGYVSEEVFRQLPYLLDRCPTIPPPYGRKRKVETFLSTESD